MIWGILWRSENKLEGKREHLIWDWKDPRRVTPKFFRTRAEARRYQQDRYGYIARRKDLRREPHGWKSPIVVKVEPFYSYEKTR